MANDKQPESNKPTPDQESETATPATISIPIRWVKVTHHTPEHIAARYPYAAYGSNLALRQMAYRCPMADPVGLGLLRNARLVFSPYLGIVEDDQASVPVGIYRLTAADIAALDRYEGLGRSYDRYLVTVEFNGVAVRCYTYVKRNNDPQAPTDRYYETCLEGFADWQIDTRRLRHAREHARKNEKKRYVPKYGKAFKFDEWYKHTFPERTGTGTAGDGDQFIPEDDDRAPPKGKRIVSNVDDPTRVSFMDDGRTVFIGKNGQRWYKGAHGVWYRAPKQD